MVNSLQALMVIVFLYLLLAIVIFQNYMNVVRVV